MFKMLTFLILCAVGLTSINEINSLEVPLQMPVPGTPKPAKIPPDPPGWGKIPNYLDNYIPAAMQVMQYLTELMQYEIEGPTTTRRPTTSSTESTPTTSRTTTPASSTTVEPTKPHKPGYYGPPIPPEPQEINEERPELNEEQSEVNQETTENPQLSVIKNPPKRPTKKPGQISLFGAPPKPGQSHPPTSHSGVLEWFLPSRNKRRSLLEEEDREFIEELQYLSQKPKKILLQIQDKERDAYTDRDFFDDEDAVIDELFRNYDDIGEEKDYSQFARKKKVPPTRAYVEMLMLYDLMKRESKEQKFNEFQGYSPEILKALEETSNGTAVEQLHFILSKLLQRGDSKRADVIARCTTMKNDLENPHSAIPMAVKFFAPLQFAP